MSVSPASGGTVEIDGKSYTTYPATLTFSSAKSVVLVAVPAIGYTFKGWSGNIYTTANPSEITMTGTKNITANFVKIIPVWLLTLIVIVAVALIGTAGYYVIHKKSMATKRKHVINRHKAHKSRKRHKNKRR